MRGLDLWPVPAPERRAYARRVSSLLYLDPGSGSLLLQALAGGVAGIVVAGKLYWGRLLRLLRLRRDEPDGSSV